MHFYSMLRLRNYQRRFLIAMPCCVFALGCEAPPSTTQTPTNQVEPAKVVDFQNSQRVDALHQRILDVYIEYWPLISSESQHEKLPSVFSDSMPEIRTFGVERVAVLLRDGEATPEELRLVVERLRDEDPSVRLAAAKLLPEVDVPDLAEYVAESLSRERNDAVASAELSFFQTRPHELAITYVIRRLQRGPVDSAAKSLFVLLNNFGATNAQGEYLVQIVQKSRRANDLPSLITLEAMLGNSDVQRKLIRLLNNNDTPTRLAVAKGFASAGFAKPLIARANDDEMYAFALEALQKQAGIEAFMELMNLYKVDTLSWDDAAKTIATSLDSSELLRADDMLKRIDLNDLRLSILRSIWDDSSARSLEAQKAIARRTVPLMIESGDAVGALQLLDAFGESLVDNDLLPLYFSTAIAASAWDAAADARPDPSPWIAAWKMMQGRDPAVAAVIRQQIDQRFFDQLTLSQKELLGFDLGGATQDQSP